MMTAEATRRGGRGAVLAIDSSQRARMAMVWQSRVAATATALLQKCSTVTGPEQGATGHRRWLVCLVLEGRSRVRRPARHGFNRSQILRGGD